MKRKLTWLCILAGVCAFGLMADEGTLFDWAAFKPDAWDMALYTARGKLTKPGKSLYIQTGKIPAAERSFMGEDFQDKVLPELGISFPPEDKDSFLLIRQLPAGAARVNNMGVLKSLSLTLYASGAPASVSVMLEDRNREEHIFTLGYLDFTGFRQLTWINPLYVEEVRKREAAGQEADQARLPYYEFKALIVRNEKNQPWFYPVYRENYKHRYMDVHYPRVKTDEYRQLLEKLDPATLDTAIAAENSLLFIVRITINYDKAVFMIPGSEGG